MSSTYPLYENLLSRVFGGRSPGYLGLRLELSDGIHYGWLKACAIQLR